MHYYRFCILLGFWASSLGHFGFAAHLQEDETVANLVVASGNQSGGNECMEPVVKDVCNCNARIRFKGFKCNKCIDPQKWGPGCDMDCPSDCGNGGSDFSGNCHPLPENCKRNSRKGRPDQIFNERGECAACASGWHGLKCNKQCPTNCGDSPEGACTRGGKCYRCSPGWYGEDCTKECPEACRKNCVMLDNMEVMEGSLESSVRFLPAGSCKKNCKGNTYGDRCDTECPANCDKKYKPSCLKGNGECIACQGKKFFGPKCLVSCSVGCLKGICEKTNGTCREGCEPGFFGPDCSTVCPAGTIPEKGCDRITGLPQECTPGMYPGLHQGMGVCLNCPQHCKGGTCTLGKCNQGCDEGYYGKSCMIQCPSHCDGPCDEQTTGKQDGYCTKCVAPYTGNTCSKTCHPTCRSCMQEKDTECLSCHRKEPSMLEGGKCVCIEGASQTEPYGQCKCNKPTTDLKIDFFYQNPKRCSETCIDGYREVYGGFESMCLENYVFKSIIKSNEGDFTETGCFDNEYNISIPVHEQSPDGGFRCIRKDFIHNIIH